MTNKELEIELNKLKKEIRALKGDKNELTFADLKAGQSFKYQDLEFTKLDDELSIIDTYKDINCCFDNYNNDYKKSLIRYFINNRYCELMNINKDELLEVNEWGDKLTLISKKEYEQYEGYIKNYDNYWWLRSPHAGDGNGAWFVYDFGSVSDNVVDGSYGARPAFKIPPAANIEAIPNNQEVQNENNY